MRQRQRGRMGFRIYCGSFVVSMALSRFQMGCSTAFRRCNASDVRSSGPLRALSLASLTSPCQPQLIPVCDTACNNYNLACPKIGAPLQDCSVRDAFSPGNPLYVSPSQEACTFANLTAGRASKCSESNAVRSSFIQPDR